MQWYQLNHMQTICTLLQIDNHTDTSPLNFYRSDALPQGMQGQVNLVGWLHTEMVNCPNTITHPSTNQDRRSITLLKCQVMLLLCQATNFQYLFYSFISACWTCCIFIHSYYAAYLCKVSGWPHDLECHRKKVAIFQQHFGSFQNTALKFLEFGVHGPWKFLKSPYIPPPQIVATLTCTCWFEI